MRVQTFSAPSMGEAMRLVETNFGKDAVILSSKENKVDGMTHITASIDEMENVKIPTNDKQMTKAIRPAFAPHPSRLMVGEPILETLSNLLKKCGVSERRVIHLLQPAALFHDPDVNAQNVLSFCLQHQLQFTSALKNHNKPIVFFGTAGVGKTLSIAKLATKNFLIKKQTAVISTDMNKAGGIEQLDSLLRILDITINIAKNENALTDIIANRTNTITLIDSEAINPYSPNSIKLFKTLFPAKNYSFVLVTSPSEHLEDINTMLNKLGEEYRPIGIMPCKLDTSRKIGGIINLAMQDNIPLMEIGISSSAANGLIDASADTMTKLFMMHQG